MIRSWHLPHVSISIFPELGLMSREAGLSESVSAGGLYMSYTARPHYGCREGERGRERDTRALLQAPLGARPPDGNTETWLFSPSSIQQGSLSVICNKCPRHILRDLEIITGWGPTLLLIGCVGPYQLRIFRDLWQIPIRKSLFSCQFKRPLKELILILIGTSSCLHSELWGLKMSSGHVCMDVCACVFILPEKRRETMQVKLTGNSSDQRMNEDSTHTHLVYKDLTAFMGLHHQHQISWNLSCKAPN